MTLSPFKLRPAQLNLNLNLNLTSKLKARVHLELADVSELKKLRKISLLALRRRFSACCQLRGGFLPADLASAVQHETQSAAMYAAESCLWVLSIQGKYEPWRKALLEHWSQISVAKRWTALTPSKVGPPRMLTAQQAQSQHQSRAEKVFGVLEAAAFQMHLDPQQAWSVNCGRSVGKVLGWLPLLSRIGAIRHKEKVSRHKRRGLKTLALGVNSMLYVWLPDGLPVVLGNLALLCQAGDLLQWHLRHPLRTCQQWLQSFKLAESQLHELGAPGLTKTSDYVLPWTFRSMALAKMRKAKVLRLTAVDGVTATQLGQMFPDQSEWLPKLVSHLRHCQWRAKNKGSVISVMDLLKHMSYKGPVELFSMDLCLCGDADLACYTSEYLKANLNAILEVSRQYHQETGLWPHQAVAVQQFQALQARPG